MGKFLMTLDPETKAAIRWRLLVAAFMVLMYHGGQVSADVVKGSSLNGDFEIFWEYDLEAGLGEVVLIQFPAGDPDDWIFLEGVFPQFPYDIRINGRTDFAVVKCCGEDECPATSAQTFGLRHIAMPQNLTNVITFRFTGDQSHELVLATAGVGATCENAVPTCSGAIPVCAAVPSIRFDHFVRVSPIDSCQTVDADGDLDVDLLDFARFQELFTGPVSANE